MDYVPCSWSLHWSARTPLQLEISWNSRCLCAGKWTDHQPTLSVETGELVSHSRANHPLDTDSTTHRHLVSSHMELSVLPLSAVLLGKHLKPRLKLSSVHCISEEFLWGFFEYKCVENSGKTSRILPYITFKTDNFVSC